MTITDKQQLWNAMDQARKEQWPQEKLNELVRQGKKIITNRSRKTDIKKRDEFVRWVKGQKAPAK